MEGRGEEGWAGEERENVWILGWSLGKAPTRSLAPESSIPLPWPLWINLFTSETQLTYLYIGHK